MEIKKMYVKYTTEPEVGSKFALPDNLRSSLQLGIWNTYRIRELKKLLPSLRHTHNMSTSKNSKCV